MIAHDGSRRDVIVIGGSAGALPALITILTALPLDIPAALAVVIHLPALHESRLVSVLSRSTDLKVIQAVDTQSFVRGTIYIAPPDRHMRLNAGTIHLDRGPKQHRTRPAIDPLFVSAAESYSQAVVGVVLSGASEDGIAGLIAIKAKGGLALVQDPAEAPHPRMPLSALQKDHVDGVLSAINIAETLTQLAKRSAA